MEDYSWPFDTEGSGDVQLAADGSDMFWKEPMDQPNFDAEQPFPLWKPDIDVLGIPSRSRKQRGWFQISRPPSSHTLNIALLFFSHFAHFLNLMFFPAKELEQNINTAE